MSEDLPKEDYGRPDVDSASNHFAKYNPQRWVPFQLRRSLQALQRYPALLLNQTCRRRSMNN